MYTISYNFFVVKTYEQMLEIGDSDVGMGNKGGVGNMNSFLLHTMYNILYEK